MSKMRWDQYIYSNAFCYSPFLDLYIIFNFYNEFTSRYFFLIGNIFREPLCSHPQPSWFWVWWSTCVLAGCYFEAFYFSLKCIAVFVTGFKPTLNHFSTVSFVIISSVVHSMTDLRHHIFHISIGLVTLVLGTLHPDPYNRVGIVFCIARNFTNTVNLLGVQHLNGVTVSKFCNR